MTAEVEPMVAVRGLTRTYGTGPGTVHALSGVTFDVAPGRLTGSMSALATVRSSTGG